MERNEFYGAEITNLKQENQVLKQDHHDRQGKDEFYEAEITKLKQDNQDLKQSITKLEEQDKRLEEELNGITLLFATTQAMAPKLAFLTFIPFEIIRDVSP